MRSSSLDSPANGMTNALLAVRRKSHKLQFRSIGQHEQWLQPLLHDILQSAMVLGVGRHDQLERL